MLLDAVDDTLQFFRSKTNCTVLQHPEMEADDLMAFLSKKLPGPNVIITTDKDLLQTITKDTRVYSPIKKKEITLDNFEEYTGVKKEYYI